MTIYCPERRTMPEPENYLQRLANAAVPMDPLMELKSALPELVKGVHAIEAVEKSLAGQKTILTNRCFEIQAEIRRLNPVCTCPSGDGSLRHPCPAHP